MKHSPFIWLVAAILFLSSISIQAKTPATYGAWPSDITTDMMTQGARKFTDMCVDGKTLYWVESRPEEKGRHVIVKYTDEDGLSDVFLPNTTFSAATRVHEYGGGALLVVDDVVYFSNAEDNTVWTIHPGQSPTQLTKPDENCFFTDFCLDKQHNRLIAIAEYHPELGQEKEDVTRIINNIVAIDLDNGSLTTLVSGYDFYSTPRLNPDHTQIAWLCWNHPNMPWDGTELYVSSFDSSGMCINEALVAGGQEESVFQPSWSPNGQLYFVSDKNNWWNIYRYNDNQVTSVTDMEVEFGKPHWKFCDPCFCFDDKGLIYASYTEKGIWKLCKIDQDNQFTQLDKVKETSFSHVHFSSGRSIFAIAGSAEKSTAVVRLDTGSGTSQIIRNSSEHKIEAGYISAPETIQFQSEDSNTSHAFYYPPANPEYCGMPDTRPPLTVIIHGGPTTATTAMLEPGILFWTSRGFAVCDVNYGGSSGYGRTYRNRLKGNWGVVDIADATSAARHLASEGKVDEDKRIIRGRSAGGYTTLASLTFRSDVFCCGSSCCGVSDLKLLTEGTHKFESRYLDQLVGSLPDAAALYHSRAPINHIGNIKKPVLLIQGQQDAVVPPDQAQTIYDQLLSAGKLVAYKKFEKEGHRIKAAENIKAMYDSELSFFSQVLGFRLPDHDTISHIQIDNLGL